MQEPLQFKIIHVAVQHQYPFDDLDSIGESEKFASKYRIAESQFNAAQIILKNPNCPVVLENLFLPMGKEDAKCTGKNNPNTIFPNDLPDSFLELTDDQKMCLHDQEAANVLLYLGKIPKLYPSHEFRNGFLIKKKDQIGKLHLNSRAEAIHTLDQPREEEAIEKCIEACVLEHSAKIKQHQEDEEIPFNTTAIMIYGAGHNFLKYQGLKYSKTFSEDVVIGVEVVDCTVTYHRPAPNHPSNTSNMLRVRISIFLIVSAVLATPLILKVPFEPLGSHEIGLSIIILASLFIGAGMGYLFPKIKNYFSHTEQVSPSIS